MTQSAPPPPPPPLFNSWPKDLLAALLLLLFTLTLQHFNGATHNEFGGHPDEAGHYVTGLMIRDYLASGLHGNPLKYAQNYYDHYPKVALGNWPPFFYLAQSAWTLPFPPTRISMMCFMAVLATFTAMVLFYILKSAFGFTQACLGALLFLSLPLVQLQTGMLMAEIPVTLLVLLATVCFGRFMESRRALDSALFGLFAAMAIMTKGNGLLLALVPPIALLFSRRFDLLKLPAFWLPAPIVAVLCGPWMLKFRDATRAGWEEPHPSWHFTSHALNYYPHKLIFAVGPFLAFLALVGILIKLFSKCGLRQSAATTSMTDSLPEGSSPSPREERAGRGPGRGDTSSQSAIRNLQSAIGSTHCATLGALLCATLIFQFIVPCGYEARHLLPALPAVIFFIFTGANFLIETMNRRLKLSTRVAVGIILLASLACYSRTFHLSQNNFSGFAPIAQKLLADPAARHSVFLVSSDSRGEGAFISEVAMREKRPGHIVQRASKALASSTWSGGEYQPKFPDEPALLAFLHKSNIGWLVLDTSLTGPALKPHHEQLRQTVLHHPEVFSLESSYPITRGPTVQTNALELYKLKW